MTKGTTKTPSAQLQPFAAAILDGNCESVGNLLLVALQARHPSVEGCTVESIEQTEGECFTGGRSTPVYRLVSHVRRRVGDRRRAFIIKLVQPTCAFISESYANERRFYVAGAADSLRSIGLGLPRLLLAESGGGTTVFALSNLRLRFPQHPVALNIAQARSALSFAARMHACFWGRCGKATAKGDLLWKRGLWAQGSFWTLDKERERIYLRMGLSRSWAETLRCLQQRGHADLAQRQGVRRLASRLEQAADMIASRVEESRLACGTLIHGDLKAANMFFTEEFVNYRGCAVCDFQFTGGGLGVQDVAYLLCPDALKAWTQTEHEDLLLHYRSELVKYLVELRRGGPASYPDSMMRHHYDLAKVDLFRHLLSRGWVASSDACAAYVESIDAALLRLEQDIAV